MKSRSRDGLASKGLVFKDPVVVSTGSPRRGSKGIFGDVSISSLFNRYLGVYVNKLIETKLN